ncbi:MAG TPA: hypothetical protein VK689_21535 [Armatimonadota bacterium]|nr:hypothetical protein [Armatimonadota bacterium]
MGEGSVTVGWMGLTLEAPEGWSPAAVSGEGTHGYLKVVSPDTRYLEVKWEQPRGAVSVPEALERYLNRLRRAARKSRQELRVKERPRGLTAIRPQVQAPIPYSWEADRKALGCIWHCGQCNRLVIAELVGQPDDDLSIAADILRGIHDHEEGGQVAQRWNTWALYGLTVPAPAEYQMEKHVLRTGHQRFALRNRGATLHADRWGLAEIALRGTGLQEWYEGRESGLLMRYTYRVEEVELHGHPALRLVGRDRLPFALLKLLRMPATGMLPRFFMRGYVWQCPDSNRIYAVLGEQPRGGMLVDEVVERMRCHQ